MRKLISFGIVSLLLIILVSSIELSNIFSSKQEALDYFRDYKPAREQMINDALTSIKLINKMGTIVYENEELTYKVYYEFSFNNITYLKYITSTKNATEEEDDNSIKTTVRARIDNLMPIEKISWIERDLSNKKPLQLFLSPMYHCKDSGLDWRCDRLSVYYTLPNGKYWSSEKGNKLCRSGWVPQ